MIDEIVVEVQNSVKKIAALSEGKLSFYAETSEARAGEGNIYLGKITKKIQTAKGKQAYFVNIGAEEEVFVNAEEHGLETLVAHEGQDIVVQVLQEKHAEKAARMSRFLTFAGLNLVYMPYGEDVDISSKIEDEEKREELYELMSERTADGGWVVRTNAAQISKEDLLREAEMLKNSFEEMIAKAKISKAPSLLYTKDTILQEIINLAQDSLSKMMTNSHLLEEQFKKICAVEYKLKPFEEEGIDDMIHEALKKEVKLPCGGRIFIEETKAFTAIDVDSATGASQGGIGRLNTEAAQEIARQIILRNLSGKIMIDFAGVAEYKFLKSTMDLLEKELSEDLSKVKVLGLSRAGNVEIIRQRRRPSLSDLYLEECPTCQGQGKVEK